MYERSVAKYLSVVQSNSNALCIVSTKWWILCIKIIVSPVTAVLGLMEKFFFITCHNILCQFSVFHHKCDVICDLCQGGYVSPGTYLFICLSVCQQLHIETTDHIFVKILPEMYLRTVKAPCSFRTYLDPDLGFFEGSFYNCEIGEIISMSC